MRSSSTPWSRAVVLATASIGWSQGRPGGGKFTRCVVPVMPMPLAPGVEFVAVEPLQHDLRADIVRRDDHVHEGIAQRDHAARRHVLVGAAVDAFLQARLDGAGFVELQLALMHLGQRMHQDRGLARAGRGRDDVAAAIRLPAGREVLHVARWCRRVARRRWRSSARRGPAWGVPPEARRLAPLPARGQGRVARSASTRRRKPHADGYQARRGDRRGHHRRVLGGVFPQPRHCGERQRPVARRARPDAPHDRGRLAGADAARRQGGCRPERLDLRCRPRARRLRLRLRAGERAGTARHQAGPARAHRRARCRRMW